MAKNENAKVVEALETQISFGELVNGPVTATIWTNDPAVKSLLKKLNVDPATEGKSANTYNYPALLLFSLKMGKGKRNGERKVKAYTDEQRTAIGIRLQTARAEKMGLTLDELRTLKVRPGQQPTKDEMAKIVAARKGGKAPKAAPKLPALGPTPSKAATSEEIAAAHVAQMGKHKVDAPKKMSKSAKSAK